MNADLVIAELPKNPLEKLVISLREYRGFKFADIRLHFLGDDEEWHATKKGITVSPDLWEEFLAAIGKVSAHLPAEDAPRRRSPRGAARG